MAKEKLNKFKESLEVSEEQKKHGISIINGRRCLHGFNREEMDEMNELNLGHDKYRKLLEKRKKDSKDKKPK